jgi:tetratricopeptide (TPR) repeat protein
MIICHSCQARNADRTVFCLRCGARLHEAHEAPEPGGDTDSLPVVVDDTPARLVDQAASQLAEGQAQAAISSCRRAVALSPSNVEAYALLGMALEQTHDLEGALQAYETALGLAPDRVAERQKASLLRLRLEGRTLYEPSPFRPTVRRTNWLTTLQDRLGDNLPLVIGGAAALIVFIVGAAVLVHVHRVRALEAQYTTLVSQGDAALAAGQYAQATQLYASAWQLRPNDPELRSRWDQAYQSSGQMSGNPQEQAAELPKYLGPNGANPFPPVPLGNGPAPVLGTASDATGTPPTVPLPTPVAVPPPPPTADFGPVRGQSRQPDITPAPTVNPRRQLPPGPSLKPGSSPLTPVTPRTPEQPSAPAGDNTPRPPKQGEITIWVSEHRGNAGTPTAPPRLSYSDAEAIRTRAEGLASSGRGADAIRELERAATAFDANARNNPAAAAAAASCRARIDYLRARQ